MLVYTRERFQRALKVDFIRFCIVGGTGFVINLFLLNSFRHLLDLNVFIAQLLAAEVALFSNFMLHHHWTYKSKKVKKTITALLLQFHASTWPAILGSALMVGAFVRLLHFNNFLALVSSSLMALLWNFFWSKYVIWRDTSPKTVEEIVS